MSHRVTATGFPPPWFTYENFPDGVYIDVNSGLIFGTPRYAGSWDASIIVESDAPARVTQRCVMVVNAPPSAAPTITSGAMPAGTRGARYRFVVTATGSPAPTFFVNGLPAGLSLSRSTGVVSGLPTTRGTYTVTLIAQNSAGQTTQRQTLMIQ
jgi:hypothetical protein